MAVCLVGTFDTKGAEFQYVKNQIESNGLGTICVNTGIIGESTFQPDITSEEVARAAGMGLSDLRQKADRGHSVTAMAKGARAIVSNLFQRRKINGILSLGGSAGTTIGTSAMQALPVGIPKVMVSTLASGDTSPYVQTKDITMVYSVVDIAGINSITRQILTNAAGAISGMVQAISEPVNEKPLIAATMFGVTTPCVTKARTILEAAGYEVLVFHATGSGGKAMEDLIRGGFITGVLDVTTTELADELVGGVLSAGPDRLEAAGRNSIPQVVAPGALDMVNFGPRDTIPERFKNRQFYQHNANVTLMRTTAEENAQLGQIMAQKLLLAQGPTRVLIPKHGVSAIDKTDQPFYSPEAETAWINSLKSGLDKSVVEVIEMDNHINDEEFGEKLAQTLLNLLPDQG
ncbi:hypothetical protein CMK19_17565 [Candidatus Poribacteria bacterium]|nr:hypothetical protein [Candidatus Poribacteria bacterium]